MAQEAEVEKLAGRINFHALAKRASHLRGAMPCTIPAAEADASELEPCMGGMNAHIEIHFQDGVVWLARIRRTNATSPPPAVRDQIFRSEYATYKFLEKTDLPTPKVFELALESAQNPVGVGYMLMEKLPGTPLNWYFCEPGQRTRVLRNMADMYIHLYEHPLKSMGCLDDPTSSHVGAFARESMIDIVEGSVRTLGPYKSIQEYYFNSAQHILNLILRDEIYPNRHIAAYLIHLFIQDVAMRVFPSTEDEAGTFYLKHPDDKGDHLLVDADFNVTGIIDWEWAFTAPEALAFSTPIAFIPFDDFYNGKNNLHDDEVEFARILEQKGQPKLAEHVRNGRIYQRLHVCCGNELEDWRDFLGCFKGLRDLVDIDAGLEWEEWKMVALARYKGDQGLKTLIARENARELAAK
ncbi:MAG: hypothetical protein LQ340_001651 [Diploschistes diacapsis]|nr:MAG: hypothetical protein LQ340_001651 [Diploschistes diacapsis]